MQRSIIKEDMVSPERAECKGQLVEYGCEWTNVVGQHPYNYLVKSDSLCSIIARIENFPIREI